MLKKSNLVFTLHFNIPVSFITLYITFNICKDVLDDMHLVPEGKICTTILKLYNEDAMVVEPAGAMSIAALDDYSEDIESKTPPAIG